MTNLALRVRPRRLSLPARPSLLIGLFLVGLNVETIE